MDVSFSIQRPVLVANDANGEGFFDSNGVWGERYRYDRSEHVLMDIDKTFFTDANQYIHTNIS